MGPTPANPKGGYNMRALREAIDTARKAGARDEELLAELEAHPVVGPRVRARVQAGRAPTDALDDVSGASIAKERYDPTAGMKDGVEFGRLGPFPAVLPGEKMRAGIGAGLNRARLGIRQLVESTGTPENREAIAREVREVEARDQPLNDTGWGKAGSVTADLATTMIPGAGATGAVLKMLPKIERGAGLLNLLGRAGRSVAGGAAGGVGAHAVIPENEAMHTLGDWGGKAAKGAAEGVVGDLAARTAGRFIKPLRFDIDPQHAARLKFLQENGVGNSTPTNKGFGEFDLSQITKDPTTLDLKASLSKLPGYSSAGQQHTSAQLADFTQSVMARTGSPSRDVAPSTLDAANKALQGRRDEFTSMGPVPLDRRYLLELLQHKQAMAPMVGIGGAKPGALDPLNEALQTARGGRMTMPAADALTARGSLSELTHSAFQDGGKPIEAKALRGTQEALDNAIRRSFEAQHPGSADAWDLYRKQMGAYLDVSGAAGRPGGRLDGDAINPKALAAEVRGGSNRSSFAAGQSGELGNLAEAADRVLLDKVPNSGTPQRSLYSMLLLGGPAALTHAAEGGGIASAVSKLLMGPTMAHHALYGKGLLGKNHLAYGLLGKDLSDPAIQQLLEKSPAFAAALLEGN